MTGASAVALFAFLSSRSLANLVRAKVRRLREPRYLVGLCLGILYFTMVLGGHHDAPSQLPSGVELSSIVLPIAAVCLTAAALLAWIFLRGSPALLLTEADVQFLFPAPLSRRAVLHYALIRPQLGVVFGAAITAFVFSSRGGAGRLVTLLGTWLVFTALHLHLMGISFTKAAGLEMTPARRRLVTWGTPLVAVGLLGFVASESWTAISQMAASLSRANVSSPDELFRALGTAMPRLGLRVLLWPARALLSPLFATDARELALALPAALLVLLVHYFWVARSTARYEEATLAQATRRAELRARWKGGRPVALAPERRRRVVPFPLGPGRHPEVAILWKGLLSIGRFRFWRVASSILVLAVVLFAGGVVLARSADLRGLTLPFVAAAGAVAAAVAAVLPLGTRNDLRGDLEHVAVLRSWPLSPRRLAAAELAGPLAVSTFVLWSGLLLAGATAAGHALGTRLFAGARQSVVSQPFGFAQLLSVAVGLAAFIPALVAVVLVVQNAAVVAFPAWFPPGRKRAQGLEASGLAMLLLLATTVLLAVGLLPAALLVVPLFLFGYAHLGAVTFALAGLLAAVPLAFEAAAGVALLGVLLSRFDPAAEGR